MTSLNISLPESLRIYIHKQISAGRYGSASEFIRELLRRNQQWEASNELEARLLKGLKSGSATPMTDQDCADIRQRVDRHLQNRRRK